jgi:hypothetical protein
MGREIIPLHRPWYVTALTLTVSHGERDTLVDIRGTASSIGSPRCGPPCAEVRVPTCEGVGAEGTKTPRLLAERRCGWGRPGGLVLLLGLEGQGAIGCSERWPRRGAASHGAGGRHLLVCYELLAQDGDFSRGLDAELDAVAFYAQHHDGDIALDDDRLVNLSSQYQHVLHTQGAQASCPVTTLPWVSIGTLRGVP